MKHKYKQSAFSLVELLIAIVVVTIMGVVMLRITKRIENSSNTRLAQSTIEIINTALDQYQQYQLKLYDQNSTTQYYSLHIFPPDGNLYSSAGIPTGYYPPEGVIKTALGLNSNPNSETVTITPNSDNPDEYVSSELLYFFLNRVPNSRNLISSIHSSQLSGKDTSGNRMILKIGSDSYPLLRFIDPWGNPIRYIYNPGNNSTEGYSFPIVESAGPDGDFTTQQDNISNR